MSGGFYWQYSRQRAVPIRSHFGEVPFLHAAARGQIIRYPLLERVPKPMHQLEPIVRSKRGRGTCVHRRLELGLNSRCGTLSGN